MLRLCDHKTLAAGTIAGGAVREPYDVRLDALWHHGSVKASMPRQVRAALIREASRYITRGEAGGGDAGGV
jgi:hypothetical protein